MPGSMENFWRLSELGASYTQTVRCSGITVQTPILLMPCFFSKSPNFSGNYSVIFFIFSLFIGQFSGECLEIIKNVGIKILPIKVYPKVTYKLSI
jgi:hypothetical protein